MKKLAFLFVAFAAISFASCGNKTSQAETAEDSMSVVVEAIEEVDSVVTDSAAAVVADSAAEAPAAE